MALKSKEIRPLDKVIPRLLNAARRRVGMSQAALAAEVGVSQDYISKTFRGKTPLTTGEVSAICEALSVNFDTLHAAAKWTVTGRQPEPFFISRREIHEARILMEAAGIFDRKGNIKTRL